jgi:hypothetical protein
MTARIRRSLCETGRLMFGELVPEPGRVQAGFRVDAGGTLELADEHAAMQRGQLDDEIGEAGQVGHDSTT